jgi:hypothetical protein
MRTTPEALPFRVKVVSTSREGFRCGYGIPVEPDASIHEIERAVRSSVAVLPPAIALVQEPLVVALQLGPFSSDPYHLFPLPEGCARADRDSVDCQA